MLPWRKHSRAETCSGPLARVSHLFESKLTQERLELVKEPIIPTSHSFRDRKDNLALLCTALAAGLAFHKSGLQPVTLGLAAAQFALHVKPGGYRLYEVAMNAEAVVGRGEWHRAISACLLHQNIHHLAGNMGALLLEGSVLEREVGPVKMAGTVLGLMAAWSGIYVSIRWAAMRFLCRPENEANYTHLYGIGFSGISFGLGFLANHIRAEKAEQRAQAETNARKKRREESSAAQLRLSSWLGLAITHSLEPKASLLGHLSGILAGMAFRYLPHAVASIWYSFKGTKHADQIQELDEAPAAEEAKGAAVGGTEVSRKRAWWKELLEHVAVGGCLVLIVMAGDKKQQAQRRVQQPARARKAARSQTVGSISLQ